MKTCWIVLAGLLLTATGCVNGPHSSANLEAPATKKVAAPSPQRPPAVYADSINDTNAHDKAVALEAELDFDAENAPAPPAPPASPVAVH
jgi:hypothetical protein